MESSFIVALPQYCVYCADDLLCYRLAYDSAGYDPQNEACVVKAVHDVLDIYSRGKVGARATIPSNRGFEWPSRALTQQPQIYIAHQV